MPGKRIVTTGTAPRDATLHAMTPRANLRAAQAGALLLLLHVLFVVSCKSGFGMFRSESSRRAIELADMVDNDPVRFETEHASVVADPVVAPALVRVLCDRILDAEAIRRREEATVDPLAREKQNQRVARYREVLPSLGEPAARVFVDNVAGAGYRVALSLELLSKMPDAAVQPSIAEAAQSGEPAARRAALRSALTTESRAFQFLGVAAELLQDPEWTVRREAARLIGECKGKDTRFDYDSALAAKLNDPHTLVAETAARALGRRGAIAKMEVLIEYLERNRASLNPGAVEAAHAALCDITNRRDIEPDPYLWRRWVEQNQPASQPASKHSLQPGSQAGLRTGNPQ